MVDKELVKAFIDNCKLLETKEYFEDIKDAGLSPEIARRTIKALIPFALDKKNANPRRKRTKRV